MNDDSKLSLCLNSTHDQELVNMSIVFWNYQLENYKRSFGLSMVLSVMPMVGTVLLIVIFAFVASRVFTIRKLYNRRINANNLQLLENFLVLITENNDTDEKMEREKNILTREIKRHKTKNPRISFSAHISRTSDTTNNANARPMSYLEENDSKLPRDQFVGYKHDAKIMKMRNNEKTNVNVISIACEEMRRYSLSSIQNQDLCENVKPSTSYV